MPQIEPSCTQSTLEMSDMPDTLYLHALFPAAVRALTEWLYDPCTLDDEHPLTTLQQETGLVLRDISYAHCSMTVFSQKASYDYDVHTAMTPVFFAILDCAAPQFLYHNVLDAMCESVAKKCKDGRIGCAFVRREEWCILCKIERIATRAKPNDPVLSCMLCM